MGKARVQVSREAVGLLVCDGVWRVVGGAPKGARLVAFEYDGAHDCYWLTFEHRDLPETPESCPVPELQPMITDALEASPLLWVSR